MSRLEELIRELCPDGVEYVYLEDAFLLKNGYTPSKKNAQYWVNGTIPWFRMEDLRENGGRLYDSIQHVNKVAVKGELFAADSIIIATSATIGEHALIKVESLANQRFTYLTRKPDFEDRIDPEFAYYVGFKLGEFCRNNLNYSSFPSVDMSKFRQFRFPVPPLPIQREIVRILDQFTELTAELTAELEKRKKQYEYYRDYLLTFDDANADNILDRQTDRQIRWITLSQNGEFYGGLTGKTKSDFSNGNAKFISYMNVFSNYDVKAAKQTVKVGKNERQNRVEYGDILFTGSSESREEAGLTSVMTFRPEEPYYLNSFCIGYKPNRELGLLPEFSKYLFRSKHIRKQIIRIANGVTRFNISRVKLGDIKIPIPPLEEQQRIVSILDRFDALCNDLTSGLPAEIEARRKQYEYYRDKLLTFKEKTA